MRNFAPCEDFLLTLECTLEHQFTLYFGTMHYDFIVNVCVAMVRHYSQSRRIFRIFFFVILYNNNNIESYLTIRDPYKENDLMPGFCRAGRVLKANFQPL